MRITKESEEEEEEEMKKKDGKWRKEVGGMEEEGG